jgi:quercetin dioxygenase-like cupin family protein
MVFLRDIALILKCSAGRLGRNAFICSPCFIEYVFQMNKRGFFHGLLEENNYFSRLLWFLKRMPRYAPGVFLVAIGLAASSCERASVAQEIGGPPPETIIVPPDEVQWQPVPPVLEEGAEMAVLAGDPDASGPFTVRLRMPDGYIIGPHTHNHFELVTVLAGILHLGLGERFNPELTKALPSGSFFYLPPKEPHFIRAEGETIIQVSADGPFELTFVGPAEK